MNSIDIYAPKRLIAIEGPDAVGKSTIVSEFMDALTSLGIPAVSLSFPGRQQGTLGKLVHEIHHVPESYGISKISPSGLQALHVAAHLDSIESVIKPHLANGTTVVLDRFWWSTWTYGEVAGVPSTVLNFLIDAEKAMWGNYLPMHVVLLERSTPLRAGSVENWIKLKSSYTKLAQEEGRNYPVSIINNEGSSSSAVEAIWKKVAINF